MRQERRVREMAKKSGCCPSCQGKRMHRGSGPELKGTKMSGESGAEQSPVTWRSTRVAQWGPGCEGHFSERSPGGSSQEQGLTIKARSDGLLGPGQLVLLSHLLQDRQVLCGPRKNQG